MCARELQISKVTYKLCDVFVDGVPVGGGGAGLDAAVRGVQLLPDAPRALRPQRPRNHNR